jgi:hypothetical protein
MMLVGDVAGRTAILIDDLADTSNTITRAAKLLKKEGATMVYALLTHGIFSGDAIDRINASALDKVVVTNSVPQDDHKRRCPKLEVLEIGTVFAEVSVPRHVLERRLRDMVNEHLGYSTCPLRRKHQRSLPIRLKAKCNFVPLIKMHGLELFVIFEKCRLTKCWKMAWKRRSSCIQVEALDVTNPQKDLLCLLKSLTR